MSPLYFRALKLDTYGIFVICGSMTESIMVLGGTIIVCGSE